MAVRRSAVERVGPFDEARELYGDEQEWQARVKAAGGRIRYVAGAALDHRRAGDDARLRALCRGRLPPRPGQPALRRLQGHGAVAGGRAARARRLRAARPAAGVHERPGAHRALARAPARGAGGARPARAPPRTSSRAPAGRSAASAARCCAPATRGSTCARRRGARACAAPRAASRRAGACSWSASSAPARSWTPRAPSSCAAATPSTSSPRPQGERGKFENLNALLAAHPPAAYDWLLVIDDDVALPRGFLDAFLCAAERTGLKLAQPAHRLHSHAAWPVTRRHPGATARETTFVEIGPVTAFHRDSFDVLLPFPEGLRMGWGLDVHWAAVAAEHGWPIGIVDATPIGHTQRPAGSGYARDAARGGGARVPRGPARTCAATRCGRWRCTGEGRDRQRVLSARPRPGARRLGPPPGAGRARRRRRRARARAAPPGPAARDAPARRARRPAHAGLAAAARRARRPRRALRAVPRPAALAHATGRGARGRRRRSPAPCARLRRSSPTTSCTPTTRCPPADAVLRARERAPLVVSVHGGDVFFTAPRYPAGERAVRRAFGAARLVLANSAGIEDEARRLGARAHARRAPRHRRPRARRRQGARPHPRHRRAPRRAQAPRRRRARAVAAARAPPAAALPDRRRRARARAAGAAGRRARRGRPRRARRPAAARGGAGPRPRRARVRHAERRRGLRRRLRRGDGRRAAGGRRARRGRARRRSPPPATGCASSRPPTSRRWRPRSTRCWPSPATCTSSAPARAPPSCGPSPGSSAGARRCRPTRTRCDDARPVLFVTNHVPPDRAGAFRALHERVPLELALFGGRSHHATAGLDDPGVPFRRVAQREVHALAASGRYAAVVCGTAGRVALPAAFLGAQRAHAPFVLWSALWGDLRTPAHLRRAPAAAPHPPPRGGRRRLRPARHRLRPAARRARGRRRAPGGRQRLLGDAGRRRRAAPVHGAVRRARRAREGARRCCVEAWRRAGLADGRLERRRRRRRRRAPRRSATPTPPRTFWSYRRSPPATSSSRGGSSPTKP